MLQATRMQTAAIFFACLALAGCGQKYTVDLSNNSRTTIAATLELESLGSGQEVLARAVLSPGEFRTLGPVDAPITDRVRISVTAAGGAGAFSERRRLDAGKTFITVGDDPYGGASLELSVRRDP